MGPKEPFRLILKAICLSASSEALVALLGAPEGVLEAPGLSLSRSLSLTPPLLRRTSA